MAPPTDGPPPIGTMVAGEPVLEHVIAIADFVAEDQGEMSIKKGDVIAILEKDEDGWWKGFDGRGTVGFVPSSHTRPHKV